MNYEVLIALYKDVKANTNTIQPYGNVATVFEFS